MEWGRKGKGWRRRNEGKSVRLMLEPMVAAQPSEDGDEDAYDDEEAQRDHPYPQPVAVALFPEPGVAVRGLAEQRSVGSVKRVRTW